MPCFILLRYGGKQEDAILHCDSAINTIIPHQSGESSLESRPSCIRDVLAL